MPSLIKAGILHPAGAFPARNTDTQPRGLTCCFQMEGLCAHLKTAGLSMLQQARAPMFPLAQS